MDSNFQVKITADISDLTSRLKAVEAELQKFSKSADKAAGAVKNMEQNANRGRLVAFAFGQVLRDSGFFAQSFSLGILAISNNIPILIDQLALSVKALQPFAGALSLVGSLLTAGLTIWAYSTQAVKQNKQSLEEWRSSLDDVTETQLRGNQAATQDLAKLDFLYKASINVANGIKTRTSAAQQLQDLYPSIFGNYSTEEIMLGKVSGAYNNLRTSILEAAKAQARFDKIVENSNKILDNQERSKQIQIELNNIEAKTTIDVAKNVNALNESYKAKGSNYQVGLEELKKIIQQHLNENEVYKSLKSELDGLNKSTSELNSYNKQLEASTSGNVKATQALTQSMAGYNKEAEKAANQREPALPKSLYARDTLNEFQRLLFQPIKGKEVKKFELFPSNLGVHEKEQLKNFVLAAEDARMRINDIFVNGIVDTISDSMIAIGQAIAMGDNVGEAFGAALLSGIATMAEQLGRLAIGIGITIEGIKKSLQTLNPLVAIGAGIALLALAGAARAGARSIANRGSAGNAAAAPATSFGGINSGAVNFPTNTSAMAISNFTGQATLETRVSGNDLVILMDRASKNRGNYF